MGGVQWVRVTAARRRVRGVGFLQPAAVQRLVEQAQPAETHAYYGLTEASPYFNEFESQLPIDHPRNIRTKRQLGLVAADLIPPDCDLHSLYQSQALTDIRNYSDQVGISIAATDFENAEDGSNIVIVKLENPTSYEKLIQFLTLIEGNLPKMQVTSIETKYVPGGDADAVEVGDIKINVWVR